MQDKVYSSSPLPSPIGGKFCRNPEVVASVLKIYLLSTLSISQMKRSSCIEVVYKYGQLHEMAMIMCFRSCERKGNMIDKKLLLQLITTTRLSVIFLD